MRSKTKRDGGRRRLPWVVWTVVLTVGACGGASTSSDGASTLPDGASADVTSPGACGADVPPGQQCNTLTNVGATITPTCVSGQIPTGSGGTIVDGTYVLTSQTYFQDACLQLPLSETIAIAGDCIQIVFAGFLSGTASGRLTTQGNAIMTSAPTCQHLDVDAAVTMDARMKTYTATGTTFTLFSVDPAGSSDVAVFTRL